MRTGVLRTLAGAERGEGVICTVIDRSIPRDLVGVAQLGDSGNSSCWNIVNEL